MIPRRAWLAALLILATIPAAAATAPKKDDAPAATILCYHVVESPNDTKFSLTRETFRQQMAYLASSGYNVISMQELQEYVDGKRKSIPKNAVVITVDDGWKCTYTVIYPELKSFNFPFTLFMYPKFVGQSAYALTWKEIREMSDNGVDIQSHAFSHPFLTRRMHRGWSDDRYQGWLEHELVESKKAIEKQTGKPVKYLAYPYGDYDDRVVEATRRAGYKGAVTAEFGRVNHESDPLRMRRLVIEVGTSFADFRRMLGSTPMQLAEATPSSGGTFEHRHPVVSAKIADHDSLDRNSVGMAVLSLGPTPYSYNPEDGTISMVVREPLASRQQVVVWGRDRKSGKRKEATWTFQASPTAPQPPPAAQVARSAPPRRSAPAPQRVAAKAPQRTVVTQARTMVPLAATIKAATPYGEKNRKK
jgi:peptidoglycan/xylan/chitin deacetylase (PgdA/CDA1 family)